MAEVTKEVLEQRLQEVSDECRNAYTSARSSWEHIEGAITAYIKDATVDDIEEGRQLWVDGYYAYGNLIRATGDLFQGGKSKSDSLRQHLLKTGVSSYDVGAVSRGMIADSFGDYETPDQLTRFTGGALSMLKATIGMLSGDKRAMEYAAV